MIVFDLKDALSNFHLLHIDENHIDNINHILNQQLGIYALIDANSVRFIEDITNINLSNNKRLSPIQLFKINYDYDSTKTINDDDSVIYNLRILNYSDYLENIIIYSNYDLKETIIYLDIDFKHKLKYSKEINNDRDNNLEYKYVIDVKYIFIVGLHLRYTRFILNMKGYNYNNQNEIEIYINYGYLDHNLRRILMCNRFVYDIQGVNYYAVGGVSYKICCKECHRVNKKSIIKLQRRFREIYGNPYHTVGKRIFERKIREVQPDMKLDFSL